MSNRSLELRILVLLALIGTLGRAPTADAHNVLDFPPTEFTIVDPQTNFAMGHGRYSIKTIPGGAILNGTNQYDSGTSDVEVAKIEIDSTGAAHLLEADHTFYKIDGSIIQRAHFDVKTGTGTCINNTLDPKIEEAVPLETPADTWSGASVLIPIQHFLREGATGSQPLHVFNCAPTPKIFAIEIKIDPAAQIWAPYSASAIQVEVRPDFGWINVLIAPFVPKLHAWFDPSDDWDFVGSESARFYKGPPIMLVKVRSKAAVATKH